MSELFVPAPVPHGESAAPAKAPRTAAANGGYRILRQVHAWIGAWGALAAIAFALTGLIQNHRNLLPLPQGRNDELSKVELPVPQEARASPEALRAWLGAQHGIALDNVRVQPTPPVEFNGQRIAQPARWTMSGGGARLAWNAEYREGGVTVQVKQSEHSLLATLIRLHKGVGGSVAWLLLSDSFALALAALGCTGIVMWARGRSVKQMAWSALGLGLAALVGIGLLAAG